MISKCTTCHLECEDNSSSSEVKKAQKIFLRAALVVVAFLAFTTFFSLAFANGDEDHIESDPTRESRVFTLEELAAFDGKEGRQAYIAYEGKIYDVTESSWFEEGNHPEGHRAGQDLTGKMLGVAYEEEVLAFLPVVGVLERFAEDCTDCTLPGWLPVVFLGKSLTAWTGYLLGIFFFLNFSTCFTMPWARKHVPWKGKMPGPDVWDSRGFLFLNTFHKPFAYLTVIFGLVHGTLGILHSFGIVI